VNASSIAAFSAGMPNASQPIGGAPRTPSSAEAGEHVAHRVVADMPMWMRPTGRGTSPDVSLGPWRCRLRRGTCRALPRSAATCRRPRAG
jgi:hypothetical protein